MLSLLVMAEYSVPMKEDYSGNKTIEAVVNGVKVNFAFDTGSSSLLLNRNIFEELLRRGQIRMEDLSAEGEAEMANGETHVVRSFIVKRLQIGECELHNIQASVGVNDQPDATPLFGQTVLERFTVYTIKDGRLFFQVKPDDEQQALRTAHRLRKDTTKAGNRRVVEALAPYVKRLSPRYLFIYADALYKTDSYEQAIRVYRQLQESESYQDTDNALMERIINAEVELAEEMYNNKSYAACEQLLKRIIEESKQPVYDYGLKYAYYSLCFVYLQQENYRQAEESVAQYADYVAGPNERLAQLYQYLSRYYASIEDYDNAQKYKKLAEMAGE